MRTQADLVDQLFNSSEKRLARILLLMAEFGKPGEPEMLIPKISQETLADMIGTTRDWVTGSLQGTWQVIPLKAAFPKCIPPSTTNLYCENYKGGVNSSPPNGTIVPCAQSFLPLSAPARPGEWQGLS
jgi:hypothetical protein